LKVLYFAWLRQRVGIGEETVNPQGVATVRDLVDWLRQRGPEFTEALEDIEAFRVAVDQEFGDMDTVLQGDEEVAFFPPLTGG
jgi:molybdopterin synthase sulfur carrier subunit